MAGIHYEKSEKILRKRLRGKKSRIKERQRLQEGETKKGAKPDQIRWIRWRRANERTRCIDISGKDDGGFITFMTLRNVNNVHDSCDLIEVEVTVEKL